MIKKRKSPKGKRPIKKSVKRISTKPKYKVGEQMYSPSNRVVKRLIIEVKTIEGKHKYRLLLWDKQGRPKKSLWINERSLRKTRKQ